MHHAHQTPHMQQAHYASESRHVRRGKSGARGARGARDACCVSPAAQAGQA